MKKTTVLFILLFLLQFISVSSAIEISCGEKCTWSVKNNILTISSENEEMRDFYSDEEVPWISEIKTVEKIILRRIRSVGQKAFQHAEKLKSVDFGENIQKIGKGAFYNSGLEEIEIPSSVISIESSAFEENKLLKNVKFSESSGKANLKEIGEKAFKNCFALETITLPDSVETIGRKMFEGCKMLAKVSFGKELKEIEEHIFMKCRNLQTITIDENNEVFMTDETNRAILSKDGKKIITFAVGSKETEFEVPFGVETIQKEAFVENQLESIIFPSLFASLCSTHWKGCLCWFNKVGKCDNDVCFDH